MRKLLLALVSSSLIGMAAMAAGTQYTMRVDGLACPYCAYGIEKKLNEIDGVRNIEIDLDSGIVRVTVSEGIELTESRMRKLFSDAGFTYRGMEVDTH